MQSEEEKSEERQNNRLQICRELVQRGKGKSVFTYSKDILKKKGIEEK